MIPKTGGAPVVSRAYSTCVLLVLVQTQLFDRLNSAERGKYFSYDVCNISAITSETDIP